MAEKLSEKLKAAFKKLDTGLGKGVDKVTGFKASNVLSKDRGAPKGAVYPKASEFKAYKAGQKTKAFLSGKKLPSKSKALVTAKTAKNFRRLGTVGRLARAATPVGLGLLGAEAVYKVATLPPETKAKIKAKKAELRKTSTKQAHADLMKLRFGGDTMLKKIPEGPKGEGLRKLKAERPDVTKKMGFAKKGKMAKANKGMSVKGDDARDIRKVEDKIGASRSSRREKGKMLKARYGTMAKGDVKEGLKKSKDFKNKLEDFRKDAISKLRGKQVGPAEEAKLNKMMPSIKDSPSVMKSKMEAVKSKISKAKKGKMMYANVGMAAKKVREKEIMKASMGKSVRGYGAARTSGMGLQDEKLIPGKSLDYYKDLM